MERLTLEQLARLVDEEPTPEERAVLERHPELAAELESLKEQTLALGSLPEIRPPRGDWPALEARLHSEGLLRNGAPVGSRRPVVPWWSRAAAAVVLFLGGTLLGRQLPVAAPSLASSDPATGVAASAAPTSIDQAAEAVRAAEERYLASLVEYRSLAQSQGTQRRAYDPAGRFAALEALLAASQAAVREAPTDPFLNGVLVSTLAERDNALRSIRASSRDNWY